MPGYVALAVNLALALPGVVLATVGLVLSLTARKRLGTASAPTLVAFVLLLVAALVAVGQVVYTVFIPEVVSNNHWSIAEMEMSVWVFVGVHTLISTAGWVVLLIAIFRRRGTTTKPANPAWGQAAPAPGAVGSEAGEGADGEGGHAVHRRGYGGEPGTVVRQRGEVGEMFDDRDAGA